MSPIEDPAQAGIGTGDVPDRDPGDPQRWLPCVMCQHLRIEHSRDLTRCDVHDAPRDGRSRCTCPGYRGLPPRGERR